MRLTNAMADQHLSIPVLPVFAVSASSVQLSKIWLPIEKNDPLAACLYFDLHHHGPKAFREGYEMMKDLWASASGIPVRDTGLYKTIQRPGGQSRSMSESILHQHQDRPASDFIAEIANRARFQNKIPISYEELRRDLSGNRKSVF